jgi:hypothetical protein
VAAKCELCELFDEYQKKLAFAYTHSIFVAGVASTQRQESMNWRIKRDSIRSPQLKHLLLAFTELEEKTRQKMALAMLDEKIFTYSPDPLIANALGKVSHFVGFCETTAAPPC